MIEYQKRHISAGEGKRTVAAEFEDEKYAVLSDLLTKDVPLFATEMLKSINLVLNNVCSTRDFRGNVCAMLIEKETTTVRSRSSEAETPAPCEVGTKELRDMVMNWCTVIISEKSEYHDPARLKSEIAFAKEYGIT